MPPDRSCVWLIKGSSLVSNSRKPKGIGIGIIESFDTDIGGDTYTVQVKLFNDMTNIGTIYVIENLDKEEIKALENNINE